MDGSATYMAVATPDYSASVRGPLVTRRRVDALAVGVALLLPALWRDVDEGAPRTDLEPGV